MYCAETPGHAMSRWVSPRSSRSRLSRAPIVSDPGTVHILPGRLDGGKAIPFPAGLGLPGSGTAFYFWRTTAARKEVKSMALRLRALTLVLGLSSLAALLADWGWNP